jgi:hypothetical protein
MASRKVDFPPCLAYGKSMASIDELITEIKRLTPEQVDEVARIIRGFSHGKIAASPRGSAVPACVVEEAVQHGWPALLFTELIGSLPDFERPAQPPVENRSDL